MQLLEVQFTDNGSGYHIKMCDGETLRDIVSLLHIKKSGTSDNGHSEEWTTSYNRQTVNPCLLS